MDIQSEQEHFFMCPYCNAKISVLLDPSEPSQEYVEDCEVCCNPIMISYAADSGKISEFNAERI